MTGRVVTIFAACLTFVSVAVGQGSRLTCTTRGQGNNRCSECAVISSDTNWSRRLSFGYGDDGACAVATDWAGDVYIAGQTTTASGRLAILTAKYDSWGNLLWSKTYNLSPGASDDRAVALSVDSSGNAYVAGNSQYRSAPPQEFVMAIRYDANGNRRWAQSYNNSKFGVSRVAAATLDDSGNFYAAGEDVLDSLGDTACLTIKYDSASGRIIWHTDYSGAPGLSTRAVKIRTDPLRNAYVAGISAADSIEHCFTAAYDTLGRQKWATAYQYSDTTPDLAVDLAVYGEAGIYLCASSVTQPAPYGRTLFALVKYDTAGNELWRAFYLSRFSSIPVGLVLDDSGNAYVAGEGTGEDHPDTTHYLVDKFNSSDGSHPWVSAVDASGMGHGSDTACGMAMDDNGLIYLAGTSYCAGSSAFSFGLVRPNGAAWFGENYDETGPDKAAGVALDRSMDVFITGTDSAGAHRGVLTVAFDLSNPAVAEHALPPHPPAPWLVLSPNPCAGPADVSYLASEPGEATLALYNAAGSLVRVLYQGHAAAGRHLVRWDGRDARDLRVAGGIYFARLSVDNDVRVQKLVLTR
jgi:hypothetical protein